jgi:hypothetical protein
MAPPVSKFSFYLHAGWPRGAGGGSKVRGGGGGGGRSSAAAAVADDDEVWVYRLGYNWLQTLTSSVLVTPVLARAVGHSAALRWTASSA